MRNASKSSSNFKTIKYKNKKNVSQTPKFEPNVNNNNNSDTSFEFSIDINKSASKSTNFELTPSKQAINNNTQVYGSILTADKIITPINNNDIMREPLLQKPNNESKTWTDDMNIKPSKAANKLPSIKQRRNSEL